MGYKKFIIVLLILVNLLTYVSAEETKENHIIELYYIGASIYNQFISEPTNPSVFKDEDLRKMNVSKPTPSTNFPFYDEEFATVLDNDVLVEKFIKPIYPDIEIYEKKIVRLSTMQAIYCNLGDFIWLSTNHGIKIIEYKSCNKYKSSYWGLFDDWDPSKVEGTLMYDFDIIYYDTAEEYVNKYKSIPADIYINNQKIENASAELVGYDKFTLPIRFIMEACGVDVQWKPEHGGQMILSDGERTIYSFLKTDYYIGYITVYFFQEPQYKSMLNALNGKGEYEYDYYFPLNDDIGHSTFFSYWQDRIMLPIITLNDYIALFGKKIDEYNVDTEQKRIYLQISDIPKSELFDVPKYPGDEIRFNYDGFGMYFAG